MLAIHDPNIVVHVVSVKDPTGRSWAPPVAGPAAELLPLACPVLESSPGRVDRLSYRHASPFVRGGEAKANTRSDPPADP